MLKRSLVPVVLVSVFASVPAWAATNIIQRASDKLRYDDCLSQAGLNAPMAFASATKWISERGGAPAEHCAAVALVGMKRYDEGASRLDSLGQAPGMGALRPQLFDQAGNAWMLAGDTGKAVASFQSALALSASDPDLYADLARAQAMDDDWPAVESDLNAALAIQPRRPDLLVLRASARDAQNRFADARSDAEAALQIAPRSPDALVERGSIERDMGELKTARADFLAAMTLNPSGETRDAAQRNLAALDAAAKPPQVSVNPPIKKK
jgi:tetratricopeptide (TPR) repeat protein